LPRAWWQKNQRTTNSQPGLKRVVLPFYCTEEGQHACQALDSSRLLSWYRSVSRYLGHSSIPRLFSGRGAPALRLLPAGRGTRSCIGACYKIFRAAFFDCHSPKSVIGRSFNLSSSAQHLQYSWAVQEKTKPNAPWISCESV
jgi:hypothetical protein